MKPAPDASRLAGLAAIAAGAALALTAPSAIAADKPVDWSAAAVTDIAAARGQLLANSPGGVTGVDPAFRARINLAYRLATAEGRTATSVEGYHFALERFANTFQDDHLWIDFNDKLAVRWPGFLIGYREGAIRIAVTDDDVADPVGATLVSCDGASAQAMAAQTLTAYVGRWSVESSRREAAPYLLTDRGAPRVRRPSRCVFRLGKHVWTRTLNWRDIDAAGFRARLKVAQRIAPEPKDGVRATEDGGYWIGIPTLNALDPAAIAGLETLMKDIEAEAPAIRDARYFVIDLRGNSGGNTFVALRVLNAIWGEGAVTAVRPRNLRAEWRASDDNIAYLSQVQPILQRLFGEKSQANVGVSKILTGFKSAVAAKRPLYVDPDEYALLDSGANGPRFAVTAKPYLFTDGGCVSSCLNLVDMVRKLPGVVQIGDETASDTFYLENRAAPLPSGHADLEMPIKVYRNRERGLNASYKPAYYWTGDMADNPAIEHWVARLAKGAR